MKDLLVSIVASLVVICVIGGLLITPFNFGDDDVDPTGCTTGPWEYEGGL